MEGKPFPFPLLRIPPRGKSGAIGGVRRIVLFSFILLSVRSRSPPLGFELRPAPTYYPSPPKRARKPCPTLVSVFFEVLSAYSAGLRSHRSIPSFFPAPRAFALATARPTNHNSDSFFSVKLFSFSLRRRVRCARSYSVLLPSPMVAPSRSLCRVG